MNRINKDFVKWVRENNLELVEDALKRGANIHMRNDAALRLSAMEGNAEMVQLLLDNGADITAFGNALSLSALDHAAKGGHAKVVKILLENKADVHMNNDASLQISVNYAHTEIVTILLKAGANVHARDDAPLRSSIAKNNFVAADKLLEYGANIHCLDDVILKNLKNNFNEALADILLPYCEERYYHYFSEEYIKRKIIPTKNAANVLR